MFRRIILSVTVFTLTLALSSTAPAAAYIWSNPAGGAWAEPANWGSSSYPRFFWDFAVFELASSYQVDASALSAVQVGVVALNSGTVHLMAPADMTGTLILQGAPDPAALHLMQGSIRTNDAHRVDAGASLTLHPGAAVISGQARSFGVEVAAGAALSGDQGLIDGNWVLNHGVIAPGTELGTAGTLNLGTYAGGLNQSAQGRLAMDITPAGHDRLVARAARLGGTLSVSLVDNPDLVQGDRFEIISTTAGVTGTFDTVEWPEGADFEVVYHTDRVEVLVARVQGPAAALSLDIKPGSCPNPLNVNSRGLLPVALALPAGVDATALDPMAFRLEGVAPVRGSVEDVTAPVDDACACPDRGPDGQDDLTLKFSVAELAAALGDLEDGDLRQLTLTGELPDGSAVTAVNCVRILAKPRGRKQGEPAAASVPALYAADPAGSRVGFRMPESGHARLTVHDVQGRLVEILADAHFGQGEHHLSAAHLQRGVYFLRLQLKGQVVTGKLLRLH